MLAQRCHIGLRAGGTLKAHFEFLDQLEAARIEFASASLALCDGMRDLDRTSASLQLDRARLCLATDTLISLPRKFFCSPR